MNRIYLNPTEREVLLRIAIKRVSVWDFAKLRRVSSMLEILGTQRNELEEELFKTIGSELIKRTNPENN